MKAILGRKVGMTQVFATDGTAIPVTVVEVLPNVVLQKKTVATDGYNAIQLGYEDKKEKSATKAELGHVKKANTAPKMFIREVKSDEYDAYEVGQSINVEVFKDGELVDVSGVNKGKGFQGSVKRHGFKIGPRSHGSGYHRGVGSLATNGRCNNRIHPGTKMPGRMGGIKTTVLNLTVVAADASKNVMLIRGAVPGPNKGLLTIRSAVKFTKNVPAAKTLVNNSVEAK